MDVKSNAAANRASQPAQLLRQGDAKVFKKYSQMKLQMKRHAWRKIDRTANESGVVGGLVTERSSTTVSPQSKPQQ